MNDAPYWLSFSAITPLGIVGFEQLRAAFGDLQTAWEAVEPSLALAGLDDRTIQSVIAGQARINVKADWEALHTAGGRLIRFTDERYPPRLRILGDAPPVLTIRGSLHAVDHHGITMVGTRSATPGGIETAHQIARDLAAAGITVISGFAKGIDAAAHRGALDAGGRTLAVLGSGLATLYPKEHAALADDIADSGALISEFRPDARPDRGRFPRRNRTMSGMSRAVLVVEAPLGSGALVTAKTAREQGRTVFVLRPDPRLPTHQGLIALADAGARVVETAADMIAVLEQIGDAPIFNAPQPRQLTERARGDFAPIPTIDRGAQREADTIRRKKPFDPSVHALRRMQSTDAPLINPVSFDLSVDEMHALPLEDDELSPDTSYHSTTDYLRVLAVLGDQPVHVDEIARQLGISLGALLAIMTQLEMDAQVQIVGHSHYRRRT
jgi:DNA processing protein